MQERNPISSAFQPNSANGAYHFPARHPARGQQIGVRLIARMTLYIAPLTLIQIPTQTSHTLRDLDNGLEH